MSDIRKRVGRKGTTYQVRYPSKSTKSGYAYATFDTLKEARAFREDSAARSRVAPRNLEIQTVEAGIQKWLDTCEFEGRDGKDPVSPATMEGYQARARIMRAYPWDKMLQELEAPDVVAFRSWLLKNYSRDQAKKVLSSFHSILLEMVTQGVLANDPAAKITIQHSRYKEPVRIPSVEEAQLILRTADKLAAHRNQSIAKAWKRYQAIIYLAADTGMRPQEYLALPVHSLLEKGVRVTQALDRSNKIGPPKSNAGRRYIPVGRGTLEVVRAYLESRASEDTSGFVFPGRYGEHQPYNKFLRRGWHTLMEKAGLMEERDVDGKRVLAPMYTPYSLRHFYASMLISQNKDLKTIQERMGHEDAAMTLNVYGHLIRQKHAEELDEPHGVVSEVLAASCGNFVAEAL
jgi:integrase